MLRPLSRQARTLLRVMAENEGAWQHGYDLSRQTGLKSGTLYPLLIRLSDRGLLQARWEDPDQPGRPPRHAYRLTLDGLALARALVKRRLVLA